MGLCYITDILCRFLSETRGLFESDVAEEKVILCFFTELILEYLSIMSMRFPWSLPLETFVCGLIFCVISMLRILCFCLGGKHNRTFCSDEDWEEEEEVGV